MELKRSGGKKRELLCVMEKGKNRGKQERREY